MSSCYIYYITSVILYICNGCVSASKYYVSADPNGEDCPSTNLPCHNISFYTADNAFYFTDDTTFYFLNGTHTLQGVLVINGASNIILRGMDSIEQGFHETVMQSTSVITCSNYNNSGIEFANSTDVILKSLTIANCGFITFISSQIHPRNANVSLFFADTNNVNLERVSVQNGSAYGLCLVNSFDVLVVNSTFANNGGPKTTGGNALIVSDGQSEAQYLINIVNSNFTLSVAAGMNLWYFNEVQVVIENCKFSHNVVGYGGGVYIQSQGNGSIEFRNCTLSNNIARYRGGGVYMNFFKGGGNIKFDNCTIYNNSAHNYGGGVDIDLQVGGGSIEFSDCTICSNMVGYN